jgi:hypothetical protein
VRASLTAIQGIRRTPSASITRSGRTPLVVSSAAPRKCSRASVRSVWIRRMVPAPSSAIRWGGCRCRRASAREPDRAGRPPRRTRRCPDPGVPRPPPVLVELEEPSTATSAPSEAIASTRQAVFGSSVRATPMRSPCNRPVLRTRSVAARSAGIDRAAKSIIPRPLIPSPSARTVRRRRRCRRAGRDPGTAKARHQPGHGQGGHREHQIGFVERSFDDRHDHVDLPERIDHTPGRTSAPPSGAGQSGVTTMVPSGRSSSGGGRGRRPPSPCRRTGRSDRDRRGGPPGPPPGRTRAPRRWRRASGPWPPPPGRWPYPVTVIAEPAMRRLVRRAIACTMRRPRSRSARRTQRRRGRRAPGTTPRPTASARRSQPWWTPPRSPQGRDRGTRVRSRSRRRDPTQSARSRPRRCRARR